MLGYFGLWLVIVPYIIFLDSILGNWTALSFASLAIPIYLSLWILWRVEEKEILAEASRRGFRLAELRKQVMHSARRTKFAWF